MEIVFLPGAEEDLKYWVKTGNKRIIKKIAQLITAIKKSPFEGIGKPEPLKYALSGTWSLQNKPRTSVGLRNSG